MQNMSLAITLRAVEKRQLTHFNLVHAAERLALCMTFYSSLEVFPQCFCVYFLAASNRYQATLARHKNFPSKHRLTFDDIKCYIIVFVYYSIAVYMPNRISTDMVYKD